MNTIARFPHSPEAGQARQARGYLLTEYQEFADAVRQAGLKLQLTLSGLLIDLKADTARNREVGNERIDDMLLELLGKQWLDIRRRYDDAGGDVERLPFPSCTPDALQAAE